MQADFVAHSCAQLGNGQSGFRAGRQPVTSSVGAERFEHTCADSGKSRQGADQEGVRTAPVEIKRDTEKLAQLTGELKDSVDKSGQGILPADTLNKAEQIEKLARTVKSKIKQFDGAGGL